MNVSNSSIKSTVLSSRLHIERKLPVNICVEDLSDFIGLKEYYTYNSRLRHVRGATVSPDSLFYTNFIVHTESLYWRKYHFYYQTRHLLKKILLGRKITLDRTKNFLLATDQESTGHFHWLTEVLARLWLVRERAKEFVLLLPDRPYIRTIGIESLTLLGLKFADIVWMRDDQFFKVPNLYHISKISPSGQMHDGIMHELRDAFVGDRPKGRKRVYISRAGAWRRKILNDEELIAMLRNHGFDVFSGEGMNLKQQVELFSECGVVVGIHGAGLTNCLFMPPGTVVELRKKERNYAYWNLAGSLGHEYYLYNGVPDSDQSLIGTGCNLTVPILDFEREIAAYF